jgi:hypothetical protein
MKNSLIAKPFRVNAKVTALVSLPVDGCLKVLRWLDERFGNKDVFLFFRRLKD